jgi:SPOR domain
MSLPEEEDFELVLGNRQLFFLAVVMFGVFFSIGYTVGYSRGHDTSDGVVAASREPAAVPDKPDSTPPKVSTVEPTADSGSPAESKETVFAAGSSVSQPVSRQAGESSAQPSSPLARNKPTAAPEPSVPLARNASTTTPAKSTPLARNTPPATETKPAPTSTSRSTTAASNSQVRKTSPAASRAGTAVPGPSPKASSSAASTPAVASSSEFAPGTLYLQVLASRDKGPALQALQEIKSKGHPAVLDNIDPDWFRILVGPFTAREAADAYQQRLEAEGIKSFLRKF